MASPARRTTPTALDILLASSIDQPLQLWLEYRDINGESNGPDVAVALFVEDVDERYQASEWFRLPRERLDRFNAFSEWRIQQMRLDTRPQEVRDALRGVTIPLLATLPE